MMAALAYAMNSLNRRHAQRDGVGDLLENFFGGTFETGVHSEVVTDSRSPCRGSRRAFAEGHAGGT